MITIIDYGAGNLFSVKNALDHLGITCVVTSEKKDIETAEKLLLPGVGAFADAMRMLREKGLADTIKSRASQGVPLLGICLGMQMLFEKSYEFAETEGLGLIKGEVRLMKPAGDLVVPHMGWNALEKNMPCKIIDSLPDGQYVYFVHSYAADTAEENVGAYCDYGMKVPAAVMNGNVYGCQFHPEKSGETGLEILKNFARL